MTTPAKKKIGAPSIKTPELLDQICQQIAEGRSLHSMCKEPGMPNFSTIMDWLQKDPAFAHNYARARETQADVLAAQIMEIVDEPVPMTAHGSLDSAAVADKRLRMDARKWMAGKMRPKVYGDKIVQEVVGANGGPLQIAATDWRGLDDSDLKQLEAVAQKALKGRSGQVGRDEEA